MRWQAKCILSSSTHTFPSSVTHGSVHLVRKSNMLYHAWRKGGRVMAPWLWRPRSTSICRFTRESLHHFTMFLSCSLLQLPGLSLIGYLKNIRDMRYGNCTLSLLGPNHANTARRVQSLYMYQSTSVIDLFSCPKDKWANRHLQIAKLLKSFRR